MKKYDIYINGNIGWPFSAEYVRGELEKLDGAHAEVLISSLGGSVLDALQIRQLFADHGDVTVHLHGFVASAATIIAMGAREVRMGRYALMLVHRCSNWVDTWGMMNAEEIEQAIRSLNRDKEDLEVIDRVVASIYADRCHKKVEDCAAMMQEARWMTADECLEHGLVDKIESDEVPATAGDDGTVAGLAACGYPLPDLSGRPQKPGIVEALTQALRNLFGAKPAETPATAEAPQPAEPASEEPAAAPQPEAPAAEPAAAEPKPEDPAAEPQAVTDREEQLTQEVAELRAQLAALQAADGDDTTSTEGDTADDADTDYHAAARRSFERLKGLM